MAKGNFIEYVISDDPNKYPNGSEQDGYYYRKVTKVETEEKTVTPTTEDLIVTPVEGKYLSQVTVQGDANFLEENIAEGITMWGKTGTHQGGGSGQYVWSKQFAGSTATEDTTGGTYTLTTADDTIPSSEIEYSAIEPTYNAETKKWEMAESTIVTLTNEDSVVPSFSTDMYVRLTSAPNIWYLSTTISVASSVGQYIKSLAYDAMYTADINNSYVEYVTGETEADYPDGGWIDGALYTLKLRQPDPIITYLTFTGNEDFTLKTANTTANWDGTLEYSTDTANWNTWDGTKISSSGSKLYLRGTGNTKITGDLNNYRFIFTGTDALKIACEGNIENLLDYKTVSAGGHPTMANYCYANIFQGCTSLTTAPELPATKLAYSCYNSMFQGCTSLTTAPSVLPATTLADFCYGYMFRDCTSLTTAPELPATTLINYCYAYMFQGCTSLTTVPELPATTLYEYCYAYMFYGCTSIKLSTTKTGEYQTEYRIPKFGTGTTASYALNYMFSNTGGTFTGTPSINTTYYTSNTVV